LATDHNLQESHKNFEELNTGEFKKAFAEFRFHDALGYIWSQIKILNALIDERQPWNLKGDYLKNALLDIINSINDVAILLQPFLPETAEKILKQFKGPTITSRPSLFPRL